MDHEGQERGVQIIVHSEELLICTVLLLVLDSVVHKMGITGMSHFVHFGSGI